jgi:hypothetical protein
MQRLRPLAGEGLDRVTIKKETAIMAACTRKCMGIESTHHSASAGFQAIIQLVSNSMTYLFLNTVLSSQRGPQSVARVYGLLPKPVL